MCVVVACWLWMVVLVVDVDCRLSAFVGFVGGCRLLLGDDVVVCCCR